MKNLQQLKELALQGIEHARAQLRREFDEGMERLAQTEKSIRSRQRGGRATRPETPPQITAPQLATQAATAPVRRRKKLSAAARKKLSIAATQRWAARRKAAGKKN